MRLGSKGDRCVGEPVSLSIVAEALRASQGRGRGHG